MSWVAVMVGVGVGATAGGVSAGLNGGDTGDILKGIAIGGALGGAGGGIGGAVFGGAGGAAAGGAGGAAGAAAGGAGGAAGAAGGAAGGAGGAAGGASTGALTGTTTGTLGAAGNAAATSAITPTFSGAASGALGGGAEGAVGGAGLAGVNGGTGLLAGGTGGTTGGGIGSLGASNVLSQQAVLGGTGGTPVMSASSGAGSKVLDPEVFAAKNLAANEADASWGSQLLSKAGIADAGTMSNTIGGQALENAVYGAGINGLMAGAQGQDVGKGMLKGAVAGGVGGAAAGGLGQMGGTIGEFATAHPMITSGGIGAITNAALNSAMPDGSEMLLPNSPGLKSNFRFNPNTYRAYLPHGNSFGSYAAGGITDLDNYDAAPNQPTTADPGTLNIPNRAEVANNEGYVGDSVKLMAHGGISDLGSYSDGGRLLKGPGTGVSDDIPATIEGRQPARLAANEFVIPARIVSEIGNGSTDAGAKALYAMMDRVQKDRKKSIGKGKFAVDSKAARHLDDL